MELVSPLVKKGVEILENKTSEIQWVRLLKDFFSILNDVYLCYTYIEPTYSSIIHSETQH